MKIPGLSVIWEIYVLFYMRDLMRFACCDVD